MPDLKKSFSQITTLEDLARKVTPIHRIHPTVKLITTLLYLIAVISFGPNQISGLIPFILYPVILISLADIPWLLLLRRLIVVLPFVLFTGISNLILNRTIVYQLDLIVVTEGMITCTALLLKVFLTVMIVFVLISTTSMNDLIYSLIQLKTPHLIVTQLVMTYRYLSVLLEETVQMYHAYLLRTPQGKGIKLKDMGSFLGQLIIRSFDRAERIYKAMKCKGFRGTFIFSTTKVIRIQDWIYLFVFALLLLIMRFWNLSHLLGKLLV